jgi:hypothetical protein
VCHLGWGVTFHICCVEFFLYVVFFYFLFLKLTSYDLIFNDFFKVQVNINLESNIFDLLIWALFIAIETKKKLKIQKQMSVKNGTVLIKAQKRPKRKKKKKKSPILK